MERHVAPLDVPTEQLAEVCHRYGVTALKIFGSVACGEATEHSDIDILVQFNKLYLRHILDATLHIGDYLQGVSEEEFTATRDVPALQNWVRIILQQITKMEDSP